MQTTATPHLHYSWPSFTREMAAESATEPIFMTNVAVSLLHMESGSGHGRWVCRGKEVATQGEAGSIRLNPADGEEHVLIGRSGSRGLRYSTLIVPFSDFQSLAVADGLTMLPELRVFQWPHDSTLQRCLWVLSKSCLDTDADRDEAARSLVLRVAELTGGGQPEWAADEGCFSSRTLGHLVAYIDSHLRVAPTAADVAMLCGLSPSHFARKFRRSVGLSLHRFVNRRRISAALELLKEQETPLSHVSLDLGFSSQSHFTQLFSSATGMSPAKYRRQFRRVTK